MILAAAATGAALDGRDAEFKAAAATLDANSVDIAKAMGSVYGLDAEQAFLPLWRRHIGFAVDYTVGVAIKDQAKQQQAVNDLIAYTQDFGAFLSAANPNLPKSVVADLVKHHVVSLKEVIDAQAAKDYVRAYAAQRAATAHMQRIADPLAGTIVKQFPDRFAGNLVAAAADLRTVLNVALREHAYLAGAATNAALGGRDAECTAAAGALGANSVDIAQAIGSVYGKNAEQAFLSLWRRHIGFFVDYTVGVATKDQAKQDKVAVASARTRSSLDIDHPRPYSREGFRRSGLTRVQSRHGRVDRTSTGVIWPQDSNISTAEEIRRNSHPRSVWVISCDVPAGAR